MCPFSSPDAFFSVIGWVRLFAELLVSDNVRLSLSAGKALANMEESMMKHGVYDSSIYLLHPLQEIDDSDLNCKKASHHRTKVTIPFKELEN